MTAWKVVCPHCKEIVVIGLDSLTAVMADQDRVVLSPDQLENPTECTECGEEIEKITTLDSYIRRKHSQYLFHSLAYYKFNYSFWEDTEYDELCRELLELHEEHPEESQQSRHYDTVNKHLDRSCSGYSITLEEYPAAVVMAVSKQIYKARYEDKDISFEQFLSRYGLGIKDRHVQIREL